MAFFGAGLPFWQILGSTPSKEEAGQAGLEYYFSK
jgi:hypothetical protein